MNVDDFNAETTRQAWQLRVDEGIFHGHIDWHLARQRRYLIWSLFPLGAMGGTLLNGGDWTWWSIVLVYGMYAVCLLGSVCHGMATTRHFKTHNCVQPEEFVARRMLEWEHLNR